MIDVPICFKKSPSLKNKNFELPLLKFINYLMKKGKKEQTTRMLFNAFRIYFEDLDFKKLNMSYQFES